MELFDTNTVEEIEMKMIRPSLVLVRFSDDRNNEDFENLRDSIKQHGLLQPILLRPVAGGFELVAGHRRFNACKCLRWRYILAKISEFSDKQAYEIQLTENIQRRTMEPVEEAEAYRKYVVDYGWGGVSELGKKIGKSEEYVSHRMKLLELPEYVRMQISANKLNVSQALELTNVAQDQKTILMEKVVKDRLTVREIRRLKQEYRNEVVLSTWQESNKELYQEKNRKKTIKIIDKSSLVLKITLSKFDDLIEDSHKLSSKRQLKMLKFLMNQRLKVHAMIDESIKYKKEETDSSNGNIN